MKLVKERTVGPAAVAGGEVVVVGVKFDAQSRELLTWTLMKLAKPGDRVIAVHVLRSLTGGTSSLLSLVKTFDSLLAVYEGFCNLKQVDLKLKVCRGSSARKILVREAKSSGAAIVVVGTSKRRKMSSSTSVAKHCVRNLSKKISVFAVSNGKIMLQSQPSANHLQVQSSEAVPNFNSSLVERLPESKRGWSILRRVFLSGGHQTNKSHGNKSSVVKRVLKLPNWTSSPVVCPDRSQTLAVSDSNLGGENGAIVPVDCPNVARSPISPSPNSDGLPEELKGLHDKYSSSCRLFSYEELCLATSNFTPENMVGKGGSSHVYKGCLPDGKELAVKILKPSQDVLREFVTEIEIITTLHHNNILSLFGFCFEHDNLLLVYDFLSRGSLEENLHGNKKDGNAFGWQERYKVAVGIAEALHYLHNVSDNPVVHRDVKSSNILLADDFEPQLSDFGLASRVSSSSSFIDTTDVAGTFGYLAPEYFIHGKASDKVDVYAFGVVLLELLSGRMPINDENPNGQQSLVLWAKPILEGGKISELLDLHMGSKYDDDQIERMVLAATLCTRRSPGLRPQINLVLKLLLGDDEVTNWARQQISATEEVNGVKLDDGEVDEEAFSSDIQSHLNLAFLDLEDTNSLSGSSSEQGISLEDYLQGRWSRSSSFD